MLLLLASLALQHPSPRPPDLSKRAHTYSIVAYDSATGDLGVAVQSKFPNVGGLVPWARAGIGAVATQSLRDRKSTRLNSSHGYISYAVICLKKKNNPN